jgi:hypothetical protein
VVEIGRVLHESMHFETQVSDDDFHFQWNDKHNSFLEQSRNTGIQCPLKCHANCQVPGEGELVLASEELAWVTWEIKVI